MEKRLRQGLAEIEAANYQAAHAAAIAMIHNRVTDPVPYFLLGRIAQDHQNYAKAEQLLGRAVELAPDQPLYRAGLGQLLVTLGRQAEALACADAAEQLPLDDAYAADIVGVIYSRTGFHERAVPLFEKAVALNPAPANFHYNLATSLQFSGQFERAEAAYRETLKRQPEDHRAHFALVGLRRQTEDHNELAALIARFESSATDADAALHLGHAIAKTLEDLDQHPESFDWLEKAKAAKRQSLDYSVQKDLDLFDAAARATPGAESGRNAEDSAPIFVIGLPRTGTTLVDRILSSHPAVTSAGELNVFADLVKRRTATPSRLVLDPDTLVAAAGDDLAGIGAAYCERTRSLARGAARFTDKMPLNFFYAGLIHRALPSARIVALRRDPTDSCLSNFRQLFSTGFSYYNYALDILDTADYYLAFDELMAAWRDRLPAERFMEVHYEEIVTDQESQTRRLLQFCGLEWDEACLRFHENAAPVSTASSVQVRQPLYTGAIGRWKKYGNRLDGVRRRLQVVI